MDPLVKKLPFGHDPRVYFEHHVDPKCRKNHQEPKKVRHPKPSWTPLWTPWSKSYHLDTIRESILSPMLTLNAEKITRNLIKQEPGKQADEDSISDLSAKGPTWLPPHKYHMF